jgi:hypothetical protein
MPGHRFAVIVRALGGGGSGAADQAITANLWPGTWVWHGHDTQNSIRVAVTSISGRTTTEAAPGTSRS